MAVVVSLIASTALAEQFTYIIPVSGSVFGRQGFYFGSVRIINPTKSDAHVEVADLIREPSTKPCSPTPPVTVRARSLDLVGSDYRDACSGIYALVVRSDQPVSVRSEVTGYFLGYISEQRIDAAPRWIEPGEEALIADVEINSAQRGNLFVVNPNEFPIEVHLKVTRPERELMREERLTVVAHSLRHFNIAVLDAGNPTADPIAWSYLHNIVISASGPFQAGASSAGQRDAYRPAIILER